jgi:hypothetical protein
MLAGGQGVSNQGLPSGYLELILYSWPHRWWPQHSGGERQGLGLTLGVLGTKKDFFPRGESMVAVTVVSVLRELGVLTEPGRLSSISSLRFPCENCETSDPPQTH